MRGVDDTRLYVRVRPALHSSEATTAVLCDGIACDGFIWKYLWDTLAERLRVAHWHYRGHGRSAMPADPARIAIPDLAGDLGRVRDHLGDPPVVLFGHSMGCQVALEGYRQRPTRVAGMVLLCGTYGRVTDTFKGSDLLTQWLPAILDKVEAAPSLARALWSRIPPELALKVALASGEIDPGIRKEDFMPYLRHMTDIDLPMFLRMLRAAGEHSAEDLLPEITCPVLLVAGENDSFTPPYLMERMAERVPHAELLLVPEGTHVAPLEQRDLVNLRIDKFVRDRVLAPVSAQVSAPSPPSS